MTFDELSVDPRLWAEIKRHLYGQESIGPAMIEHALNLVAR
jgi:hypothetical protein